MKLFLLIVLITQHVQSTYLDCVGVEGLLGVKGFACGFNVNFLAGLSFDDGGVVSFEFDELLATFELLLLV